MMHPDWCEGLRVCDLQWGRFPTKYLAHTQGGCVEERGKEILVEVTHDFAGSESGELQLEKGNVVKLVRKMAGINVHAHHIIMCVHVHVCVCVHVYVKCCICVCICTVYMYIHCTCCLGCHIIVLCCFVVVSFIMCFNISPSLSLSLIPLRRIILLYSLSHFLIIRRAEIA